MKKHRESPIRRINPSGQERWIARYTAHDGRRLSAGTFKLKREAQEAIDAAYGIPTNTQTVEGYLEHWLRVRPRSARTDQTNESRIRNVLDVRIEGLPLRGWDLRSLRRRHRDELVTRMLVDQGRAPGGARNILRALSAMFEDAITDELVEINPWQGAKIRDDDRRAQKKARKPRVWTFEQMHKFAAKAGKNEAMIRVLADCGLRIGELFALKRADLEDGLLRVRGTAWEGQITGSTEEKDHDREVPVPPGCMAIIRAMPVRIDSQFLFPSPAGKVWRYSNFTRRVWQKAQIASGMDPTPHEFRHSFVTHLRAAGIDPADLADVSGHSVEVATRIYTHPQRKSFDQIRGVIG
jgi:integrase